MISFRNFNYSERPANKYLLRLASVNEDWYVFTSAIATLQTLSHHMPRALDMLIEMASSDDVEEAELAS